MSKWILVCLLTLQACGDCGTDDANPERAVVAPVQVVPASSGAQVQPVVVQQQDHTLQNMLLYHAITGGGSHTTTEVHHYSAPAPAPVYRAPAPSYRAPSYSAPARSYSAPSFSYRRSGH